MVSEFPPHWRELPLEDCMEAIIDYRGKTPEKKSFGIPLVTAKIVKAGRIEAPQEFIAPEKYDSWMRRGLPRAGDVVMTTEAPLGEIAQLDGTKVALAQRIITLRGNASVLDNDYLKYAMQGTYVQEQLRARASGTTILGIKQSELRRVNLLLPPLSEQRFIAKILGTIDDKIELNNRTNNTLESMARALFKSWFVNFDPVSTKAKGRQPNGMDVETARLFPSEFEMSELGNIPNGWVAAPMAEVAEVIMGQSPPGDTYNEIGIGTPLINGPVQYGRRFPAKNLWTQAERLKLAFDADLIFCVRGSTTGKRVLSDGLYALGRGVCSIRSRIAGGQPFIVHTVESGLSGLLAKTTGSVFPNLSGDDILGHLVIVPPRELITRFGRAIGPIYDRLKTSEAESMSLAKIREVLLPRLLSGELRSVASNDPREV